MIEMLCNHPILSGIATALMVLGALSLLFIIILVFALCKVARDTDDLAGRD